MKAKLIAVQEAMLMGSTAVIASGHQDGIVEKIVAAYPAMIDLGREPDSSAPGSWFLSLGTGLAGRKRWILSCRSTRGTIVVDEGARVALEEGNRSLLPSGVAEVVGNFHAGDPVGIAGPDGQVFAQGLANLSSQELARCRGRSSREARDLIGRAVKTCVAVHHDDMVLMREVASRG
jgi:glutamate 5-kinase